MQMPTAFVRDRVVEKFNLLLKALTTVPVPKLDMTDRRLMEQVRCSATCCLLAARAYL
jgi:hypothetical protein